MINTIEKVVIATKRKKIFLCHRNTGRFQKFDYGRRENLKRYGSVKPPAYNLSNVHTTVNMMHGDTDTMTPEAVTLYISHPFDRYRDDRLI